MKLNRIINNYNLTVYGSRAFVGLSEKSNKEAEYVVLSTLPPSEMYEKGIPVFYAPVVPCDREFSEPDEIIDADLDCCLIKVSPKCEFEPDDEIVIASSHPSIIAWVEELYSDARPLGDNVNYCSVWAESSIGELPLHLMAKTYSFGRVSTADNGDFQISRPIHIDVYDNDPDVVFYDEEKVVEGFSVKPGYLNFVHDGTRFFSSGVIYYGKLKAYYWNRELQRYIPEFIEIDEIYHVMEEIRHNDNFNGMRESLGLSINFNDWQKLNESEKKDTLTSALSLALGSSLSPNEIELISSEIVSRGVTPRVEITDSRVVFETQSILYIDEESEDKGCCIIGDVVPGSLQDFCSIDDCEDYFTDQVLTPPKFNPERAATVLIHREESGDLDGLYMDESYDVLYVYVA